MTDREERLLNEAQRLVIEIWENLGLRGLWECTLRIQPQKEIENRSDEYWETPAFVTAKEEYHSAHIYLHPDHFFEHDSDELNTERLYQVLFHESLHLLISPYHRLHAMAHSFCRTEQEHAAIDNVKYNACESTVTALERAFGFFRKVANEN